MSYTIPVSATVQVSPPSSGTSTTGLKPGLRTLSLTGVMGTGIVLGDAVRLWGSNDGGTTYQPIRQNGRPITLSFTQPEVVIDDACDHYATQRLAVGVGSTLAAVGFGGEGNGVVSNPWLVGGNDLGGAVGVLGTNDLSDLQIKSHGKLIVSSDGDAVNIKANVAGALTLTRGLFTWAWPGTDVAGPLRSMGNGTLFFRPVNVLATNTNAQSIVDAAAAAIITTWTETTDTEAAFNATTGVFTAPLAGFYQISAQIEFAAAAALLASDFSIALFKGGVLLAYGNRTNPVAALAIKRQVAVNIGVQLAAADTIDVRAFQDSGGAVALTAVGAANFLSISLVG